VGVAQELVELRAQEEKIQFGPSDRAELRERALHLRRVRPMVTLHRTVAAVHAECNGPVSPNAVEVPQGKARHSGVAGQECDPMVARSIEFGDLAEELQPKAV
jgi:hypothetical protein